MSMGDGNSRIAHGINMPRATCAFRKLEQPELVFFSKH
jgi:hypothetical protein